MRFYTCFIALLAANALHAQGTKAEYERAAAMPKRVYAAFGDPRVVPNWDESGDQNCPRSGRPIRPVTSTTRESRFAAASQNS